MSKSLTSKQKKAVSLLVSSLKSNKDVSEELKISEQTLYNWLKDPAFTEYLNIESAKAIQDINKSFQYSFLQLANSSLNTIHLLMNSKNENIKLKSAMFVLTILQEKHRLFGPLSQKDIDKYDNSDKWDKDIFRGLKESLDRGVKFIYNVEDDTI